MKFLFFGPQYSPFQWCLEVAAGSALKNRGHEVAFVTCGPRAFGFCDVVNINSGDGLRETLCKGLCTAGQEKALDRHGLRHWAVSDFWTSPESDQALKWAAQAGSIEDLREARYKGYPLFEIAKWSVYRFIHRKDDVDPNGPDRWLFVESMKNSILALEAAERILSSCPFDGVVVWNGLKFVQRAMVEVARRRRISFFAFEHGMLTNTCLLTFNQTANPPNYDGEWRSWEGHELEPDEERWIDDYFRLRMTKSEYPNFFGSERSLELREIRESLGIPDEAKIVSFFPNLTWDTAMEGVHKIFGSQKEWLVKSMGFFEGQPGHFMVIRAHPCEKASADSASREPICDQLRDVRIPPNVRMIPPDREFHSYSLARQSSFVVNYISTMGLEAAYLGKPVVMAGKGHAHGKGATWDPMGEEEYFRVLASLCREPIPPPRADVLAKRYAHMFFRHCSLPLDFMEEPVYAAGKPLWETTQDLVPGRYQALDWIAETLEGRHGFVPNPSSCPAEASCPGERLPYNLY